MPGVRGEREREGGRERFASHRIKRRSGPACWMRRARPFLTEKEKITLKNVSKRFKGLWSGRREKKKPGKRVDHPLGETGETDYKPPETDVTDSARDTVSA